MFTNEENTLNKIYEYLLTYEYFTEEELDLITKAFGDNIDTYNTICYVRFGFDVEQLAEMDKYQIC